MTVVASKTAALSKTAASNDIVLRPQALTAAGFAAFGDVIETDGRQARPINEGTCLRFDDLAHVDVLEQGGRPALSIFEAEARPSPVRVRALERHPLASQAFMPLQPEPFLIIVAEEGLVAEEGRAPLAERLRVYLSSGRQGVNYRRNVWHHPLIALTPGARFLVVDRAGPGQNCEEYVLEAGVVVEL